MNQKSQENIPVNLPKKIRLIYRKVPFSLHGPAFGEMKLTGIRRLPQGPDAGFRTADGPSGYFHLQGRMTPASRSAAASAKDRRISLQKSGNPVK